MGLRTIVYPGQAYIQNTLLTGNFVFPGLVETDAFQPQLTTWNPLDKAGGVTLSNGNLTGTAPGAVGTGQGVRSATSRGAGYYCEITFSSIVTGQAASSNIALANSSASLSTYFSINTNSIAYNCNGSVGWNNLSAGGSPPTWGAGDVMGILVGTGTSTVKFYKNGVLAFTSSGTSFPPGALFAGVTHGNTGDTQTINFGATALSFLPSGATAWDGGPSPLIVPRNRHYVRR